MQQAIRSYRLSIPLHVNRDLREMFRWKSDKGRSRRGLKHGRLLKARRYLGFHSCQRSPCYRDIRGCLFAFDYGRKSGRNNNLRAISTTRFTTRDCFRTHRKVWIARMNCGCGTNLSRKFTREYDWRVEAYTSGHGRDFRSSHLAIAPARSLPFVRRTHSAGKLILQALCSPYTCGQLETNMRGDSCNHDTFAL